MGSTHALGGVPHSARLVAGLHGREVAALAAADLLPVILLVVAVPALDLALAAALEVLLHLDLHADLVALVGVQRAPSQQHRDLDLLGPLGEAALSPVEASSVAALNLNVTGGHLMN